jgi:N-acetylmuramoyl-L-alanine amidase
MIDPDHGGKDPGAIGVSGTFEKHVALAAAEALRLQLESAGRYRVELTRSRDQFVPLDERVARAQSRGAALFVSLHADAVGDHAVRGASVYTLSPTASDAQTAALARREKPERQRVQPVRELGGEGLVHQPVAADPVQPLEPRRHHPHRVMGLPAGPGAGI